MGDGAAPGSNAVVQRHIPFPGDHVCADDSVIISATQAEGREGPGDDALRHRLTRPIVPRSCYLCRSCSLFFYSLPSCPWQLRRRPALPPNRRPPRRNRNRRRRLPLLLRSTLKATSGGSTPCSTRFTRAASPTATTMASAIFPASTRSSTI